jgi:hypothetical protein
LCFVNPFGIGTVLFADDEELVGALEKLSTEFWPYLVSPCPDELPLSFE